MSGFFKANRATQGNVRIPHLLQTRTRLPGLLIAVAIALVVIGAALFVVWDHRWSVRGSSSPGSLAVTWFNSDREITQESLRNRAVLWVWFGTWCAPCMKAVDELNDLQAHYKSMGLTVLALTGESPELVNSFVNDRKVQYVVGAGASPEAFGVAAYPHYRLVQPDGTTAWDGQGEVALAAIKLLLSRGSALARPGESLFREGVVVGQIPSLSANRELDAYHLWALVRNLDSGDMGADGTFLESLFRFYWANFPSESTTEDAGAEIRHEATLALKPVLDSVRDHPDLVRCLRQEAIRRVKADDPDRYARYRIVRFFLYVCESSDVDVHDLLKELQRREKDPFVQKAINEVIQRKFEGATIP
ncbi:MAG: TlpA family protein disulfide reductase [Phycisphaerae bacterium]|nr:TlpA family protein disulfide reductase [Planctomycetia bacterium]MCK6465819.1 TlpA family protein disulfide reductase [Phycisphaerae bacterium]MCL4719609.1 TlpA family protein disulfide reductase [Phycisphaerae bacterium]NUQ10279.1 TlpA family protein disulfide reductase [Phycisphaerae bacterium]